MQNQTFNKKNGTCIRASIQVFVLSFQVQMLSVEFHRNKQACGFSCWFVMRDWNYSVLGKLVIPTFQRAFPLQSRVVARKTKTSIEQGQGKIPLTRMILTNFNSWRFPLNWQFFRSKRRRSLRMPYFCRTSCTFSARKPKTLDFFNCSWGSQISISEDKQEHVKRSLKWCFSSGKTFFLQHSQLQWEFS